MIGVASPEYQLSVGNLGEFVTRLSSAVLTSGDIVSVYTRGNLGAVVRVFDPETGTVTQTTLFGASSVSPELWGFTGMDLVALAGGGFAVFGRAVNTSNGATPAVWLFDATGVQVGTPVRVLGASAANVTMHATDSGFLLTWSDRTAGVDQAFVQAFTAAGAPIGSPQFVGQVVDKEMDIVELSNGRMALAWTTTFGTMELAELNANGVLTGVRVTADNSTSAPFGWSMGPKLVADGNGFLSLHIDDGLVLTRFSAGFVQQGSAVRVQAAYPGTGDFGGYPKYNQNEFTHDIAVLPNGVIVIAYAGYDAGAATVGNVYIRYLAPDGTPLTDPITANARVPDDQRAVTLLTMPDGRIFLSFIDDTNGIFGAQQYAQGVWLDGPDGYFVGDADANTANGGTGDDAMLGNGGNDTLGGLGGDDQVSGGDGDDSLNGGDGEDQVNGGSGNDVMSGDNGDDIVLGGAGNDTGSGGEGLDVVSGQDGNDLLSGNRRDDVLYGGADDDTLDGGSGSDVVEGGDGVDSLYGDGSADTLKGGAGNDRIDGGSGKDSMDGDLGDDLLLGQKGDDAMYGGDGNDTIRGAPKTTSSTAAGTTTTWTAARATTFWPGKAVWTGCWAATPTTSCTAARTTTRWKAAPGMTRCMRPAAMTG